MSSVKSRASEAARVDAILKQKLKQSNNRNEKASKQKTEEKRQEAPH